MILAIFDPPYPHVSVRKIFQTPPPYSYVRFNLVFQQNKMLLENDQLHQNSQFDVKIEDFYFSTDKLYYYIAVNYRLPLYYKIN